MKQKVLMTASVWNHIQSFHLPYLKRFRALGWQVHVACANIPKLHPDVDKTIELPFVKEIIALQNFSASHMLRRIIIEEKYSLIITHTSLAAFFTRLAVKGLKKRPRLVVVMHGYLFNDDSSGIYRYLFLNAERLNASVTDLLLTMNSWDYSVANHFKLGKKIEFIPGMGVDFSRFDQALQEDKNELRKKHGISSDDIVLVYPAEFSARKRQIFLINSMPFLPENTILLLPGTGDHLNECKEIADKEGVSQRVIFPGFVDDVGTYYRIADIAVTASRSEGLPFNVIEAMYMGLPVVATAVKGHTDLIEDEKNGYLFNSIYEFIEKIKVLINDQELMNRFGRQAKAKSIHYGLDQVIDLVLRYYLSVL